MIYLDYSLADEEQTIFVPCTAPGNRGDGSLSLSLRGTVSGAEWSWEVEEEGETTYTYYYRVSLTLSTPSDGSAMTTVPPRGEYEYSLTETDGGRVLETGICVIGSYRGVTRDSAPSLYDSAVVTYEQYGS